MAFPGTYLNVTVEVALGADLTADASTWAWTDATALGLIRATAPITITRGGFDGSVQSPPSQCTFTADNIDGRWVASNPSGAWYGQIGKGTPVRVKVNEGTPSVRFTGFLTSLPPRWNTKETDRYVPVTASGILQRLQRGQAPLRSALVREISSTSPSNLKAYWPGEDGSGSTQFAEFSGGPPMRTTGQVVTFADEGPDGSLPLPEFTTVAGTLGHVPNHPVTGGWTVLQVMNVPASPSAETIVFRWYTSGSLPEWHVTVTPGSPDTWTLKAFDASGAAVLTDSTNFTINDGSEATGHWLMLGIAVSQNGTGIDYTANLNATDGGPGLTGTIASHTVGVVKTISLHANSKFNGVHAGHWAVWDTDIGLTSANPDSFALDGWDGQYASLRLDRLCEEEGFGVDQPTLSSTPGTFMGPQGTGTFLDLLRECEAVASGRLSESLDPTTGSGNDFLRFYHSEDFTNEAASLTLNHDSGTLAPPFDPVDDDQQLRNDWTVTRSGGAGTGSSARVIATEGEFSSLTPANVGTYNDSTTVNVYSDDLLIHQAGWRVNIGTIEGLRFPAVTLDFARASSLIASWITCDIGDRVTITNPPDGLAPDNIDLFIEGWTETLSSKQWTVQLNCSPYRPWRGFRIADTSSDTNVFLGRLAGDPDCALRIAVNSSDTSFTVDSNYYRWTTTSDDFPLNIRIGGEVCTLSSISNGASTFINVGTPAHADNAAVTPGLYTSNSIRQIIFILAAIRSSGTGTLQTPTDYTRLPVFPEDCNVQLFAKVHDGSESNPTVTPSGGSAGDTVSAVTFGFSNISNTWDDLGDIVVDKLVQLNASAQNIAYGGLYARFYNPTITLILGWKQDDYTSVALPAGSGFTEMVEASSTTGSDQSLYIAYRIDSTTPVTAENSLAVTGGASAISRSAVVAITSGVQTFTVSARSVNGVTKSHSVGARIAVEDPAVLAL